MRSPQHWALTLQKDEGFGKGVLYLWLQFIEFGIELIRKFNCPAQSHLYSYKAI